MHDDGTTNHPDADLPAPEESPFFSEETEPEGSAHDADEAPAPAASAGDESPRADLGSTQPHTPFFDLLGDEQVAQPTALLEPVAAAPLDPESAQLTQLIPELSVDAPAAEEGAASEELPAPPADLATVPAGSRVVIVVSRGAREVISSAMASMPHVTGMLQGEALSQLQQAGVSAQVFNEYSDLPRGEVMGQLPPATQSMPAGSEAVLLVSTGPAPASTVMVPLPDVVGMSEADALFKLQSAGLSPQTVRDFSQTVPLGMVIAQLPGSQAAPEVPRKKRSLWWLWLLLAFAVIFAASGAVYYYLNRTAIVPNVVGYSQSQAESAISAAGFRVGAITTTQTLSASDVGKIATQSPLPGTQLKLIDRVNITVSGGQKLFAVPDVTGRTQEDARSVLTSAGLQVSLSQAYNQTVTKDAVISQSPPAGEEVPFQTTVGLTISLGVQNVTVPGVQALTRADAANKLKAANLSSQAVVEYTYTGATKGTVFAQYPTAGMQIAPGTIVGLLVSNGLPPSSSPSSTPTAAQLTTVPSVVGQRLKTAQATLKTSHLSNTIINWSGTGRPAGEVVGQAPEVNTTVPRNVAMIIFVSNGK